MTFPASTVPSLGDVLSQLQNQAGSIKSRATAALSVLQTGTVDTVFVFQVLDQLNQFVTYLNQVKAIVGLNAYATANLPGYIGTLTTDITTVITNAQAVTAWVVANFPTDVGGFIQAFKFNADGSRTATTFSNVQTAGLQSALATFINSIG